jgi:hypothetical protein
MRIKHEKKTDTSKEIAELEASLLAEIDAFDLDAAVRRAHREYLANSGAGMTDPTHVFPEIVPAIPAAKPAKEKPPEPPAKTERTPEIKAPDTGGNLLDQLRHQAEVRQREIHCAMAERSSANEAIDQALKHIFFYLHELVQQLNIIKPEVPRNYPLIEQLELSQLAWQEGFADYRTQSQSAGALVELVSFSYRLASAGAELVIERDGPAVERFRTMLFDFGLPFTCKEFKNERCYVERAEFEIRSEVSVNARWRADFSRGVISLEARNLERLGSALYDIRPEFVDRALLDEFARLVLSQPNRFRELAKRQ